MIQYTKTFAIILQESQYSGVEKFYLERQFSFHSFLLNFALNFIKVMILEI